MTARKAAVSIKPAKLRCAIYTRKSSEEGLEQSFNSLHAQREACEAYVLSQAGEGWGGLAAAYDDGGISGGTMERPGLQQLLRDVDAGEVDVVVVYKVDRLTRSLADFAKIVERFDAQGVSFVSVTQAFNTTSSMGRLTLNVLLSFAQFEREVTGERIRDKIAMSKAKGLWMGGAPPLGYDPADRTLAINPVEAQLVRRIFERYLELGSVYALRDELEAQGARTKRHIFKDGRERGDVPFSRGMLFNMLKNRTYLGEIRHRTTWHPGLHPAILDPALFDAVQARMAQPTPRRSGRSAEVKAAALRGRVYDDAGNRMTPVESKKGSRLYRYYVSTAVLTGRVKDAGTLPRFPAVELERLVADRADRLEEAASVSRIVVGRERVVLTLTLAEGVAAENLQPKLGAADDLRRVGREVQLACRIRLYRRGGRKLAQAARGHDPVARSTIDLTLLRGLVKAQTWKAKLLSGEDGKLEALAEAEGVNVSYARRLLRLAFLSPNLKRAILDGRAPVGLTLQAAMTRPIPLSWRAQEQAFAA